MQTYFSESNAGRYVASDFWDQYWANLGLPSNALDSPSHAVKELSFALYRQAKEAMRGTTSSEFIVTELGGAPGTFLSALAHLLKLERQDIDLRFFCLDSSDVGLRLAKENFQLQRLNCDLIRCDLLRPEDMDAIPKANFVFSLGLVEHFEGKALHRVIQAHLSLCLPGGMIFICIPVWRPFVWSRIIRGFNPDIYFSHNADLVTGRISLESLIGSAQGKQTGKIVSSGFIRDWEHWEVLGEMGSIPRVVKKMLQVGLLCFDQVSQKLSRMGLAPIVDRWIVIHLE